MGYNIRPTNNEGKDIPYNLSEKNPHKEPSRMEKLWSRLAPEKHPAESLLQAKITKNPVVIKALRTRIEEATEQLRKQIKDASSPKEQQFLIDLEAKLQSRYVEINRKDVQAKMDLINRLDDRLTDQKDLKQETISPNSPRFALVEHLLFSGQGHQHKAIANELRGVLYQPLPFRSVAELRARQNVQHEGLMRLFKENPKAQHAFDQFLQEDDPEKIQNLKSELYGAIEEASSLSDSQKNQLFRVLTFIHV